MQNSPFNTIELLCSHLFHDIMNPITVLSFHLDEQKKSRELAEKHMDTLIHSIAHLEYLFALFCENIKEDMFFKRFSLSEHLKQITEIMEYKSRKKDIQINFFSPFEIFVKQNQLTMHKLFIETMNHFFEAHEETGKKHIEITLQKTEEGLHISFSTTGIVWEAENLKIKTERLLNDLKMNFIHRKSGKTLICSFISQKK